MSARGYFLGMKGIPKCQKRYFIGGEGISQDEISEIPTWAEYQLQESMPQKEKLLIRIILWGVVACMAGR